MLKHVLLASSMLIAAPAFAQETPKPDTQAEQQQTQAQDQAKPETHTAATDDAQPGTQNARDQATTAQAAPQPAQPTQGAPASTVAQTSPPADTNAQPAATASAAQPGQPTTPQKAETAAATPAQPSQPAASQEQVAQAVGKDFGTYDKDANNGLDKTEFAAWMSNLRKAAEPNFAPGTPEANAWSEQAFTQADTDKSASITKQELTVFLTPKQPS